MNSMGTGENQKKTPSLLHMLGWMVGLALKIAFIEFVSSCVILKKFSGNGNCVADRRCHKVIQHIPPENMVLKYFISFFFWLFLYKPCQINTRFIRKHASLFIASLYSFTSFPTNRYIQDLTQ